MKSVITYEILFALMVVIWVFLPENAKFDVVDVKHGVPDVKFGVPDAKFGVV